MTTSEPPVSGPRPKADPAMRGLPSLARARAARKSRYGTIWNWLLPLIAVVLVVWWRVDAARTTAMRDGLLARQREVAQRLGSKWLPLRDRIEMWTAECGAAAFEERPNPDLASAWDFRSKPGIYLRLGQKDAASVDALRAAAMKSFHDGFSSCLFTSENPSPAAGARCESTQDCASGELCNELNQCAVPGQPYNLRMAYRAMHVLSDEWLTALQTARSDLQLRGTIASFDATEKFDLPIAAELLARAEFFMLVVDEPASDAPTGASVDVDANEERSIPDGPHFARACLWRLRDGEKLVALRREAAGVISGGNLQSEDARLARQRQANGCALALEFRQAIGAGSR